MNYYVMLVLWLAFSLTSKAQSFYNGSFETHTLNVCTSNQSDQLFNSKMPHLKAFGKTNTGSPNYLGETDILDTSCFTPQDGAWCLGIGSNTGATSDAIALELNSPLVPGTKYYLSFYVYGNTDFQNLISGVKIGESLTDSTFGIQVHLTTPNYNAWAQVNFSFTASQPSQYITVKTVPGYSSWNLIDNFELSPSPIPLTTAIRELNNENAFSFYPNPATNSIALYFEERPRKILIEISDELGQLLFQQEVNDSNTANLDLSNFSNGYYVIRTNTSNFCISKKLIIAR